MISLTQTRYRFTAHLVRVAFVGTTLVGLACAKSYPQPPETRQVAVVDTIHGTPIPDPYRWLEDQYSEEVHQWIAAQNAYADSIIGKTASRDSITARLRDLMAAPSIGGPRRAGDWEYFTLRRTGDEVASIYRREAPEEAAPIDPDANYETILDPLNRRSDGTTSIALDGLTSDGKLLLYSVRDGGQDEISYHVHDLEAKRDRPDSLPNALYASVGFDRDGKGIYYVHRSREVGPRFKYHKLGTPVEADAVLFGDGLKPTAFLNATTVADGRNRLFTIGHGWARNEVWWQDLDSKQPPRQLTQGLDAHFAPQYLDGKLWVRTDLGAPKGRIVIIDPLRPDTANWTTVIAEGEDVIDSFSEIDGKIYVTYVANVATRIAVYSKDGKPAGDVAVPPMSQVSIRGQGKGAAILTVTSLTQPSESYRVDLTTNARTVWEPARIAFDTAGIEVKQVWYTSKDGTKAPMYLMHKRGIPRDGSAPALLHG